MSRLAVSAWCNTAPWQRIKPAAIVTTIRAVAAGARGTKTPQQIISTSVRITPFFCTATASTRSRRSMRSTADRYCAASMISISKPNRQPSTSRTCRRPSRSGDRRRAHASPPTAARSSNDHVGASDEAVSTDAGPVALTRANARWKTARNPATAASRHRSCEVAMPLPSSSGLPNVMSGAASVADSRSMSSPSSDTRGSSCRLVVSLAARMNVSFFGSGGGARHHRQMPGRYGFRPRAGW